MANQLLFGVSNVPVNNMLAALGIPNPRAQIELQMAASAGNWASYAQEMFGLTSGMGGGIESLFSGGLPQAQYVPRPYEVLPQSRVTLSQTYYTPTGAYSVSQTVAGGNQALAQAFENQLLARPAFRDQVARLVGGLPVANGSLAQTGQLTVQRYRPSYSAVPYTSQVAGNPMLSGIYSSLANWENKIMSLSQSMVGGNVAGTSMGNASNQVISDPETAELADGMGMSGPFSFEELLFLMMMKYARKKEKEILDKMNELSKNGKDGEGGGGRRGYGGGSIGSLVGGIAGSFVAPGVGTAIGSQLGGAVGGAIGGDGGGAGGGGSSGPFGDTSKQSDTLKQMQMQYLMEQLKKMYEMLSNVMKSMHDMQMTAVRHTAVS